jgi:hypothetical protein
LSERDSIIIDELEAVKLTDSLNSSLPYLVRKVTINYFSRNNMNPDEYYTIRKTKPFKLNMRNHDTTVKEVYIVNFLRIGALRDIVDGIPHAGASGGKGDNIQVVYDIEFKEVLMINESE